MDTATRERIVTAASGVKDKAVRREIESAANDADRTSYAMLGWEQKCLNSLTAAANLGRADLYDAAMEEFTQGGKSGRGICPQSAKQAAAKVPRPSMYDSLVSEWQQHGGTTAGAIPRQLFQRLESICRSKPKARVLEFGSGLSTILFDRLGIKATSVEDSSTWASRLRGMLRHVTLIHSPLETTASGPWYSWRPGRDEKYDVILIDGPIGEGASSPGRMAAKHFVADCMAHACTVIIDDCHREREQELSSLMAAMYGFTVEHVADGGRRFDVLTRTTDSPIFHDGVGSEVSRKLASRWGVEPMPACGCTGRIREMNWRGPQWCRDNIDIIVDWLHEGSAKWKATQRGVTGVWVSLIPEFAERAYIRGLVTESIESYSLRIIPR